MNKLILTPFLIGVSILIAASLLFFLKSPSLAIAIILINILIASSFAGPGKGLTLGFVGIIIFAIIVNFISPIILWQDTFYQFIALTLIFIAGEIFVIKNYNLKKNIEEQIAKEVNKKTEQFTELRSSLEAQCDAKTIKTEEERKILENRVKQQEKDLEEIVGELEKYKILVVGRELKMIELKKEIKELKRQK